MSLYMLRPIKLVAFDGFYMEEVMKLMPTLEEVLKLIPTLEEALKLMPTL